MGKYRSVLKSLVGGAALGAGLIGAAAPASADINLNGFAGPVSIHFQDFESVFDPSTGLIVPPTSIKAGDELVGILSVTSIFSTIGSIPLWGAGQPGDGFLLGVFVGPTITAFNPGTGAFTSANPWTVSLYSSSAQYNASQGVGGFSAGGCGGLGTACYNTINQPGSGNVLQLDITTAPGVDAAGNIADGTFSLTSLSGSNFYNANVTGGAAMGQFNSNGVVNPFGFPATDFNINSDFCVQGSGISCNGNQVVGDWGFVSNDPVVGNVVPEPGSLALLGGGLVTLAAWSRRRRKATPTQA